MNSILIVSRQPPNEGLMALDAIDAALAASNVGLHVTFLLEHKGVLQLLEQTCSVKEAWGPSISKRIKSLPLYDIDELYICGLSKKEFLSSDQPCIDVDAIVLNENEKQELLKKHKHIIKF